jgi:hypothetical protein
VDDDAVEAVVYKNEHIAEKPGEEFHRTLSGGHSEARQRGVDGAGADPAG